MNSQPLHLSDLIGKPVVRAVDGERLGRAWDVRIRRENKSRGAFSDERWVAIALVVSERGALERFGFLRLSKLGGGWRAPRETIAWDRIEKIGPDAIVVSD